MAKICRVIRIKLNQLVYENVRTIAILLPAVLRAAQTCRYLILLRVVCVCAQKIGSV